MKRYSMYFKINICFASIYVIIYSENKNLAGTAQYASVKYIHWDR